MKKHIVVLSLLFAFAMVTAAIAQESAQQQASKKATVKVVSVDVAASSIEAKDQKGTSMSFKVSPQAKITKEGKSITLADIKAEDTLSIEYDEAGGVMTLKSATVTSGKG